MPFTLARQIRHGPRRRWDSPAHPIRGGLRAHQGSPRPRRPRHPPYWCSHACISSSPSSRRLWRDGGEKVWQSSHAEGSGLHWRTFDHATGQKIGASVKPIRRSRRVRLWVVEGLSARQPNAVECAGLRSGPVRPRHGARWQAHPACIYGSNAARRCGPDSEPLRPYSNGDADLSDSRTRAPMRWSTGGCE